MLHNKNHDQDLIEALKDDAQADAYFFSVLDNCKKVDKQEAQKQLELALKNLTHAQGGLANMLSQSRAQSFYSMLSSVILKFVR